MTEMGKVEGRPVWPVQVIREGEKNWSQLEKDMTHAVGSDRAKIKRLMQDVQEMPTVHLPEEQPNLPWWKYLFSPNQESPHSQLLTRLEFFLNTTSTARTTREVQYSTTKKTSLPLPQQNPKPHLQNRCLPLFRPRTHVPKPRLKPHPVCRKARPRYRFDATFSHPGRPSSGHGIEFMSRAQGGLQGCGAADGGYERGG